MTDPDRPQARAEHGLKSAARTSKRTDMNTRPSASDPTPAATFELERWPFYHIARLNAYYVQRLNSQLKPLGIDVVRWRVLSILSDAGTCPVSRLADETFMQVSTMGKLVQRMTAEGLVTSRTSRRDARVTAVTITDKGATMLADIRKRVIDPIRKRAMHDVTEEEIETLNGVCDKLFDNLTF